MFERVDEDASEGVDELILHDAGAKQAALIEACGNWVLPQLR